MTRSRTASLIAAGLLCVSLAAHADIIFIPGNNPQADEENILFNGAGTEEGPALTVSGRTNQSDLLVNFTSSENLVTPSNGQARIEAEDGAFSDLSIALADGGTFGDFILNPDIGGRPNQDFVIHVTVHQLAGPDALYDFNVSSNGQNFLTIVAANGQRMTSIDLLTDADIVDLKQPRISSPCPVDEPQCVPEQVPEPGSLALLGLGALALAAVRRRRQ